MAKEKGWNIDRNFSTKITLTEDVDESILVTEAGAICGAGGIAAGIVDRDYDISEDGTTGEIHAGGIMVGLAGAAIASLTVPMKSDANGNLVSCDTDKDFYVGFPKHLQPTTGGQVQFIWNSGYYTV